MRYFPVFLDLRGRLCVVVGGGSVGQRKALSLLKAGGRVAVISPEITPSLSKAAKKRKLDHIPRAYRRGDLKGAFLAVAATGDRAANERIFRDAARRGIPVNVVDDPAHSSFIVPSVVEKKDLVLAISTSGRSPAVARFLRRKLESEIGPEYETLLRAAGNLRRKLIAAGCGQKENQKIFRKLLDADLLALIRAENEKKLDRLVKTCAGPHFSWSELAGSKRDER